MSRFIAWVLSWFEAPKSKTGYHGYHCFCTRCDRYRAKMGFGYIDGD